MISGRVNGSLEAEVVLQVRGENDQRYDAHAVIDTGFSGAMTLPVQMIAELKLPHRAQSTGVLADGTQVTYDVHEAFIDWDGRWRRILVAAIDGTPLVGMTLMRNHALQIQVRPGGDVTVEPLA